MCHGRLAAGEAPACVQACPSGAIRIEVVKRTDVVRKTSATGNRLLPGTVESSYTRPPTRFESERVIPANARPADENALRLESPHWPLAIMLILTQLAGGLHAVHAGLLHRAAPAPYLATSIVALATLIAGLAVSFTHLGRPLKAWRVFLGLRRSWMSREIIAFSAYAAAATALVFGPHHYGVSIATAALAFVGVGCSAMIYIDTRRPFWAAQRTLPKFFGTTALLGATIAAALFGWTAPSLAPAWAIAATIIRTGLFAWEWSTFLPALRQPRSPIHRSALVLARLQQSIVVARVFLFVASTAFSIMAIFNLAAGGAIWGTIAFVTTTTSQMLERHTFFTASAAPRMPGGVPA
jgi:DMSO reductase anchor subunit